MLLKKSKTSLPAIVAIVIIALGIAGVSYAHWSEFLYIDGTAETGELEAAIVTWFCDDAGIDPGYAKDVGSCYCSIDEYDPHYAYVTLEDAYPSYEVRFTCDIHNTGTIPWFMLTPKVDDVTLVDSEWVDFDLDGDGDPDVNIMYIDGEDKQVHPCEFVEWSLRIHVKQTAHEDFTYHFTLEVEVIQWNMVVP